MTLLRMMTREIRQRKLNAASGVLATATAIAALVGAHTLLRAHDTQTERVLQAAQAESEARLKALNQDMRKATLKLSFNLVILPKGQNLKDWYAQDYATKYMPEDYVTRLADSGIVTVRHFLPSLQQRITWPEKKQTIILVGTRGEVPNLHKNPVRPLVEAVPPGTIVLGYELHRRLSLAVGETVQLMGRRFTVHKCHAERGNKDDVTAWIHLREAQELLDKEGKVNAILALECLCVGPEGVGRIRREIGQLLPDTQVLEQGTKALARAETRLKVAREGKAALERERSKREELRARRERLAAVIVPLVLAACALWIGLASFGNVRERRDEIGILRAIGLRSVQILCLFAGRALLLGLVGGAIGYTGGAFAGVRMSAWLEGVSEATPALPLLDAELLLFAMVAAPALALIAGWVPALLAARQHPADVLARE